MPCMCGDICCPSCGPAQGNYRCPCCGAWDSDQDCTCTPEQLREWEAQEVEALLKEREQIDQWLEEEEDNDKI